MQRRIIKVIRSGMRRESRAPIEAPTKAAATAGSARRFSIMPCFAKRPVASVVPKTAENLLVPMAVCTGIPAKR